MKAYEVRHRCKTFITIIDKNYQGGSYPYCKKCGINITLPAFKSMTTEFKLTEIDVPMLMPVPTAS